jgi:DNA replication and repair protein RecF
VVKRWNDLIGKLNAVSFAAHDIDIITGSPSLRRRYMDVTLSQSSSSYVSNLASYTRVVIQRNTLLRQIQEGKASENDLEFWDGKLIDTGSKIISERIGATRQLNKLLETIHSTIAKEDGELSLCYIFSLNASEESSVASIAGAFERSLAQQRKKEIAAGQSTIGPHRDDLRFVLNGRDISKYGSRGQQRTAALALRLAEANYIKNIVSDSPVLLLDDMLAELDSTRRRLLLETIFNDYEQTLITTTDEDRFSGGFAGKASLFRIENGTVKAQAYS